MSVTEQEAIRRLRDHFRIHDDGRPTPYLDEAVDMAIKALEKQIPKKPEICADVYNAQGELIGKDYRCSECGMGVAEEYICCPYCSQLLDWSEV